MSKKTKPGKDPEVIAENSSLEENHKARYFTVNDPKADKFIFTINKGWWSRPYEYLWASSFLAKGFKVLDLACGLPHPFRFICEQVTGNAYACDLDSNISSKDQTLNAIRYHHGEEAVKEFNAELENIQGVFDRSFYADIRELPKNLKDFDVIFCISVLEHLENKEDIGKTFKGIFNALKEGGLAVVTFDYPDIEPKVLIEIAEKQGLKAIDPNPDFELPENAITTFYQEKDLKVFRCVFKK